MQEWNLLVKNVGVEDSGLYECQVTTYPPQSIMVMLHVPGQYCTYPPQSMEVMHHVSGQYLHCHKSRPIF
jgi:hypothetical protein